MLRYVRPSLAPFLPRSLPPSLPSSLSLSVLCVLTSAFTRYVLARRLTSLPPSFPSSLLSSGVCPAEALRIRMVANAETFGETWAGAVEQEGGAPSLWDGFPPLVVRQVQPETKLPGRRRERPRLFAFSPSLHPSLLLSLRFHVFDSVGSTLSSPPHPPSLPPSLRSCLE